jgi:hypothetical protein
MEAMMRAVQFQAGGPEKMKIANVRDSEKCPKHNKKLYNQH